MPDEELLHVLVVDDDVDAQELLKLAFSDIGVRSTIQLVNSGNEAIAYLKGQQRFADRERYHYPSLIILDLKMADGDGFSVLEYLKSTPQYRIIPTVVMSASADPDDVKKSYMLGASTYLVKPYTFDALKQMVSVLHDHWLLSELPTVDSTGMQVDTDARGKLGARFPQNF